MPVCRELLHRFGQSKKSRKLYVIIDRSIDRKLNSWTVNSHTIDYFLLHITVSHWQGNGARPIGWLRSNWSFAKRSSESSKAPQIWMSLGMMVIHCHVSNFSARSQQRSDFAWLIGANGLFGMDGGWALEFDHDASAAWGYPKFDEFYRFFHFFFFFVSFSLSVFKSFASAAMTCAIEFHYFPSMSH